MIGVFVIALLALFSTGRLLWRARSVLSDRAATEARVKELEAERDRLRASIETATDPAVTERTAKENLNLRNPGEQVVVVQPSAPLTENSEDSASWWEKTPLLRTVIGWFSADEE